MTDTRVPMSLPLELEESLDADIIPDKALSTYKGEARVRVANLLAVHARNRGAWRVVVTLHERGEISLTNDDHIVLQRIIHQRNIVALDGMLNNAYSKEAPPPEALNWAVNMRWWAGVQMLRGHFNTLDRDRVRSRKAA